MSRIEQSSILYPILHERIVLSLKLVHLIVRSSLFLLSNKNGWGFPSIVKIQRALSVNHSAPFRNIRIARITFHASRSSIPSSNQLFLPSPSLFLSFILPLFSSPSVEIVSRIVQENDICSRNFEATPEVSPGIVEIRVVRSPGGILLGILLSPEIVREGSGRWYRQRSTDFRG